MKNFEILDGFMFRQKSGCVRDIANDVRHDLETLATHGIPCDRAFIMAHKDDFKEYLNAERDKYLSSASIIPAAVKNEVKIQYADLYDKTHSALEELAHYYSDKSCVFDEPDENGMQFINEEKTTKATKESCMILIDGEKFQQLRDAIKAIRDARNAFCSLCNELKVPLYDSGYLMTNSENGSGTMTRDYFWHTVDADNFNDTNLDEFVKNTYNLYIRKNA